MRKSREDNPKIALLADARKKKEDKEAKERKAIKLDKRERREIAGFAARQREIASLYQEPLNVEVNEFVAELQERYGVTINVTHDIDFQNAELVPKPEEKKEETPPETKPEEV